MKKILCLTLSAALALTLLAGCRGTDPEPTDPTKDNAGTNDSTNNGNQPNVDGDAEAVQVLGKIWDEFGEDEKFASFGGNVDNPVDNGPGQLDLQNAEELTGKFMLPEEHIEKVKNAASLTHMMNSNIFTAAVFRLENAADTKTVADALSKQLKDQHWICGSPDRLLVAEVLPGRIVMVYAGNDAMTMFREKMDTVYPDTVILLDEAVAA